MKEFLFLGDSITDCYHTFDPEDLGEGYVRMLAKELGHQRGELVVTNMGVDGCTISSLHRLWNLFCTKKKPSFISILIGINDISVMKCNQTDSTQALQKFQNNYEDLLVQILSQNDCPVLLMGPFIFPHPAEFVTWETDVQKMNEIIQTIANKHHLSFLPLQQTLSKAAATYGYDKITTDGVHLTKKGHQLIADAWLQYFITH